MVRIVDFKRRTNSNGEEFYALVLESGLELVKSKATGNYYATSKKASITSTFNEATCANLIGQQIPGSVQRVECEPYDFTVKVTGEVLTLTHRWVYLKEGETVEERIIADSKVALPI